jgi:hypothetical protein
MIVTVLGWTMMWAEALRIVVIMPVPWTIAMFGLGLAMIRFASAKGGQAGTQRQTIPNSSKSAMP